MPWFIEFLWPNYIRRNNHMVSYNRSISQNLIWNVRHNMILPPTIREHAVTETSTGVLKFHSTRSVVTAQHTKFNKNPPNVKAIQHWYEQFVSSRCLSKDKSSGQPLVTQETVNHMSHVGVGVHKLPECASLRDGKPLVLCGAHLWCPKM